MAYQNVGTPRIYLNIPEYLASNGLIIDNVFRTLPVSASAIGTGIDPATTEIPNISAFTFTDADGNSIAYIALLGHTETSYDINSYTGDIINGTQSECENGFSISKLSGRPISISTTNNVGSIVFGAYYDFPHSPDLNLTLSYEYDGIKEIATQGGATLTNAFYTKPPAWGSLGAWELGGYSNHAKSGRRVWDLSFSYLSDSSVFPDNAGLVNETGTNLTLLEDDTFQRVIHLTNGGQLPFIFQADNTVDATSPKPDQFAICKFDQSSFQFKQVANGVYNVKLKIREVW